MRFLKLFEDFGRDILSDIKDILDYIEDDLDLRCQLTNWSEIEEGSDLEIFITNGQPVLLNKISRFRFNSEIKKYLDSLVDYLSKNNLKFKIQLYSNAKQVIVVDGRGGTMKFDYIKPNYGYITREIKHITDIPNDRWVNYIQIIILNS
jgi:hypothetical protein